MPDQTNHSKSQIDWREFTALACLLSLRNSGQLDPHAIDDEEDLDELDRFHSDDASVVTTSTDLIAQAEPDGLKKRFLDRLAELLAKEKGGTHVASAVIRDESQEGRRVDIWVARNCGFEKCRGTVKTADEVLLEKVRMALGSHSQPYFGGTTPAIVLPGLDVSDLLPVLQPIDEELWQAMLVYSIPRLKDYRKDLKNCFLKNKARLRSFLEREGGSLTEAQRTLQTTLRHIFDECHRFNQADTQPGLESLVLECFQLRQRSDTLPLIESILDSSTVARKLHTRICYLGRLRTAYYTFLELAQTFPPSTQIIIHCTPKSKPSKTRHVPLTLGQTFKLLNLEMSETLFRTHVNPCMTLSEGQHEFEILQKQKAYVHAEIQLLHHAVKDRLKDIFPYIGASKRSCFLCASFIKANGGFEIRGTHGHLYSKWYVPQTDSLAAEQASHLVHSLLKIQKSLKRQLCIPAVKPANCIAESSIGLTVNMDDGNGTTESISSMEHYRQQKATREYNQAKLDRIQMLFREAERKEGKAGANSNIQSIPNSNVLFLIFSRNSALTTSVLQTLCRQICMHHEAQE